MFEIFREKNQGIAFILVLIVLVAVGTLVSALLRSSRTHISTAVHEENMSQTFYAADSGVELVRSYREMIVSDLKEDNKYNSFKDLDEAGNFINPDFKNPEQIYEELEEGESLIDYIFSSGEKSDNIFRLENNTEFFVEIESVNSYGIQLSSTGKYDRESENAVTKKIIFDLSLGNGLKNFNILKDEVIGDNIEDYYEYNPADGLTAPNLLEEEYGDFDDFYESYLGFSDEVEDDFSSDINRVEADEIHEHLNDTDVINKNSPIFGSKPVIIVNDSLDFVGNELRKIEDVIIIVDGFIDFNPQAKIKDSVIIVREYVNFSGASGGNLDWHSPMFFIYGDTEQEDYLEINGTGDFSINIGDLPDEFSADMTISSWKQQQ